MTLFITGSVVPSRPVVEICSRADAAAYDECALQQQQFEARGICFRPLHAPQAQFN
jgi:hypothetical protein